MLAEQLKITISAPPGECRSGAEERENGNEKKSMKVSELYKGSYLKAADLGGKTRRYTIASISEEQVGEDQKPVIRFEEVDQALVLNKTNAFVLAEAWGDEMDDWGGNPVILKPDKATFGGKLVDCIRVAVPQKKTPPAAAQPEGYEEVNL